MTKDKILRLVDEYNTLNNSIGKADIDTLLEVGLIFDLRFVNELVPYIESMLTINKGRWQLTEDSTDVVVKSGRKAKEIASQTIDLVTDWTIEHFESYYKQGIELWNINRDMIDEQPVPVKLIEGEPELITSITHREILAWQDHLQRHGIQIERYVRDGMARGWTTERFIELSTCPDGHMIGYLFSNARISWYEHLRRYGAGRPGIMAQTALERRGNESQ